MSERTKQKHQQILKDPKKIELWEKKKQSRANWEPKKADAEKTAAKSTSAKTVRRSFLGTRILYNCPKCGQILTFQKRRRDDICQNCRQKLDWADYDNMNVCWILAEDSGEAGYWAEQYVFCNGNAYGIDVEKWMRESRDYPVRLYFPFPDGKAYGRFMRKAAKEAHILKDADA